MGKDSGTGYVISRLRRFDDKAVYVAASSRSKPELPAETKEKWQRLVNHVAVALRQPHALITRLDQDTLYVFLHNETEDATFIKYDRFPLGLGVYCETTLSGDTVNFVPDSLSDEAWKDNPSVEFSLISYIGVPIRWPDGELFGTLCALGDKPMPEDRALLEDIALFKSIAETDLQLQLEKQETTSHKRQFDTAISEVHHRVKNHLNILCSLIQLDMACDLSKEEFVAYQKKLTSQIKGVAELHTLLAYEGHETVELSAYIRRMMENWIKAAPNRQVRLDASLEKLEISGRRVVYFGMLLNELVTNSFTHAFGPDHPDPTITLALEDLGETFRFTYRDNGPGFRASLDSCPAQSLGITMLFEITVDLGGRVTQEEGPGASFVFVLPKLL
ncbi:Blue-light-activated histidine kinase 2 [Pseudodesulfovibrio hydrargyri]|uniref:histidine kinase n=1 Tax=Pseudodesulfovibrio hydrargyri TaxID=2125990 RepID=A0A1J5MYM8_9BACT|nr:histidine kinase dimerization/phosphoacceptor domain -containing protein [Pseudodesulfovibrio hydrargyri]OIQ51613.1 Blue-light-activated histidine kinase 2 [Pseudodesulfovibrio hydrargyri]